MSKESAKKIKGSIDRVLKCVDYASDNCKNDGELFAVSATLLSNLFIKTLGRIPEKKEYYDVVDKLYATMKELDPYDQTKAH